MAEIDSIGKYEVRREIGRGAMGVVYEAYDPSIKRVVALKTIRRDQLAGNDSAAVIARFRREAQAAGRLNHPNIVSIYDFGEDQGVWFIAMEFVHGRELKECFEANERFKNPDIVRIMAQILGALDYSHRQGVIHRDVKPANIFLLSDGSVKVADFGIAHVESSNLTQVGTVLGTPSYMSPEQILGLPVDGRSDLFSAGVILYQFLTGERPFAGSAATTMQKVLKEEPLSPSLLNIQVLPAMDAVARTSLAKRADDRFQTAREFADAIDRAGPEMAVPPRAAMSAGNSDPTIIVNPDQAASRVDDAPGQRSDMTQSRAPTLAPSRGSRATALAIVVAAATIAAGAGTWFVYQQNDVSTAAPATGMATQAPGSPVAPPAPTVALPAPTVAPPASAVASPAPTVASTAPTIASPAVTPRPSVATPEPGTMVISAVGLVDPSDKRYQTDRSLLQSDLRADSKSELVAKAMGLLLEPKSLTKNYDVLKDRLLSQSGSFIKTVIRESEPRTGKDGLMSMTTEAVVNVKAIQKSLNQMSRDERIELIRASGDPRVSVQIAVRDADRPDAAAQPSPVAANILKERIKSFGFRTWTEDSASGRESGKDADFAVVGEAKIKKLSTRLEASGLTVTKYTLSSWTVKSIDRETGEEIYYNTTLPKGVGSWASEEAALAAIGAKIADQFSRDFFLQHANVTSRRVALSVEGMPDANSEDLFARELVGLPEVIAVTPRPAAKSWMYEMQLAGTGAPGDLVAQGVLKPINAKLGQQCFTIRGSSGDQVAVVFDQSCAEGSVLSRLETNPPAGLYGAPPSRQKTVVKNPETLRKLSVLI